MVVSTKDIMPSEEKGYDNFLPIFEFFHMIEGLDSPCMFSRDRTNIEDIRKYFISV